MDRQFLARPWIPLWLAVQLLTRPSAVFADDGAACFHAINREEPSSLTDAIDEFEAQLDVILCADEPGSVVTCFKDLSTDPLAAQLSGAIVEECRAAGYSVLEGLFYLTCLTEIDDGFIDYAASITGMPRCFPTECDEQNSIAFFEEEFYPLVEYVATWLGSTPDDCMIDFVISNEQGHDLAYGSINADGGDDGDLVIGDHDDDGDFYDDDGGFKNDDFSGISEECMDASLALPAQIAAPSEELDIRFFSLLTSCDDGGADGVLCSIDFATDTNAVAVSEICTESGFNTALHSFQSSCSIYDDQLGVERPLTIIITNRPYCFASVCERDNIEHFLQGQMNAVYDLGQVYGCSGSSTATFPARVASFAPSDGGEPTPSLSPTEMPSIAPSNSPSFSSRFSSHPSLEPFNSPSFSSIYTSSLVPSATRSMRPSVSPSLDSVVASSEIPLLGLSDAPSESPSSNPVHL